MPHYSILIFDEGFSTQAISEKFAEQEMAHLVFTSNGRSAVSGAVDYLSRIRNDRELRTFMLSSGHRPAEANAPVESALIAREQRKFFEALRDITIVLNQSLNLDEVLECILTKVEVVVPYDATNIMLIDDGVARMAACRGYEKLGGADKVMRMTRVVSEVPNLKRMAETGQPIVVPDTRQSPDWIEFKNSSWIRSYVSVPIVRQGSTIGFLNLNSAIPGLYNDLAAERLMMFASQAAVALENARLYESAQRELADRKRAEEALQITMNELEARVELRTAELREANDQLTLELSRRREAEEALEKERALLATRVEERTAELSAANAELARAVRMKDSFLANMSHELRTPLNAILNLSETLLEQVYGELNEAELRSVKTIEDSGRHLLTLINDILDLSKIGAGKFDINFDTVPVRDVCQASLSLVAEAARKKQISVSTTYDPQVKTVWADQRRLRQILLNLLSNAVKFTPTGGRIGLDVTGDRQHNTVQFMVWDTGIGIPPESMGSLFKPFVQLDNSLARQYEGTGLGLALVYHIVELHGGGVRVESSAGQGSRFIVRLNWDGDDDSSAEALPQDTSAAAMEEREGDDLTQFVRLLQETGILTRSIWVERSACPAVGSPVPDFLVVESRAAHRGMVDLLRSWPTTCDIPLLILGRSGDEDAAAFQSIPGAAYLSLPCARQDLRAVLRSISRGGTASLVHSAVMVQEKISASFAAPRTILLVDDNENGIRAVSDYLMAKGYRVIRAYNGADAVERARDGTADLILMDIQMPGMDGFEAIRCIRSDRNIRQIPIFAFTALAMPTDRQRCLEVGATEYLSKPLSLKLLTQMINAQFQREPALENDL